MRLTAGRVVAASQITHQRRLRLLAQSLGNFRSRGRRETPSEIGYEGLDLSFAAQMEIVWQK